MLHLRVLLFGILCMVVSSGIAQQQWPMLNAGPQRTSWASQETELHPPLMHSATFVGKISGIYSGLSFNNGLLIAGIEDAPNMFTAFNVETGDTLWSFGVPESGGSTLYNPAQNDSIVILGGQHGDGLHCMDVNTGQESWFLHSSSQYSKSTIIDLDRAYVCADSLVCLNINNGNIIWSQNLGQLCSPTVDNSNCYISTKSVFYAFNKYTGAEVWTQEYKNLTRTSMAADNQHIYALMGDSVAALNKADGTLAWAFEVPGANFLGLSEGSIAVDDSVVCASMYKDSTGHSGLFVLNKFTGTENWNKIFDTEGMYVPTIANGVVYFTQGRKYLYGYDLATGEELFENHIARFLFQPIVADGKLFVASYDSVYMFANEVATGVLQDVNAPQNHTLLRCYPNPFNPATTIQYQLPEAAEVTLTVYNISGQQVSRLVHSQQAGGQHTTTWNAGNMASGVYFCRLEATGVSGTTYSQVTKLVLQK